MIVCINIGGLHPPYELDPSSYDVHFRCNGRDGPRAVCDSDQPRRLVWPPRPRGFFMRPVGPAALVEWGSLPAVGILVIPLDRFNASLPTEGSDQGDVHDFPPATRDNKHGDTRGVWMPGHRVGVGDLNFAAVRHANVERLERPLILGFLELVDLHFPPPFDSSPRRSYFYSARSVAARMQSIPGKSLATSLKRKRRALNDMHPRTPFASASGL